MWDDPCFFPSHLFSFREYILEAAVSFKMSFKNDELTLAAILENKEGSGGEKILVFPQGNGSLNVFFNLKATLIVGTLHTYTLTYW